MHKKIIFFDGDGTLWYPTETKRTKKPYWVYIQTQVEEEYLSCLELVPGVRETLEALRASGVKTVILSTHPHEAEEAARRLAVKVTYFGLQDLFDEIHATPERVEAKGEKALEILLRYNLELTDGLMVGDSYEWDYLSVRNKGIDAVLVHTDYHIENASAEPAEAIIYELEDLLSL